MESGEQFSIFFKEPCKSIFEKKGDFGSFSREQGNADSPGGLIGQGSYLPMNLELVRAMLEIRTLFEIGL